MNITDLANTYWLICAEPDLTDEFDYSVNFESCGTAFSKLRVGEAIGAGGSTLNLNYGASFIVYADGGTWLSRAYRLVRFVSGMDTVNPLLIAWLANNAEKQSEQAAHDLMMDHLADEINRKSGSFGKKTVSQLVGAANSITVPEGSVDITENGTVSVFGYAEANVNVTPAEDAEYGTVYTVSFDTNGADAVQSVTVYTGCAVTAPQTPSNGPGTFLCWCSDAALTAEYDFSSPVCADTTLYAKWSL